MVSVIIPHYNDLESLRKCLGHLQTQTLDPSRYEIIVADNNSSCGFVAVEQACEGVARVVPAPIPGAAEARNAAVAVARGEVLAFTDQDCRPMSDWLERGVRALDSADIVGGRMIVSVDDPMRVTPVEAFELVFAFNNRRYVERKGFTVNANMFVWRHVFPRVGLSRVGVPEDVEWGIVRRRSVFACDTRLMLSSCIPRGESGRICCENGGEPRAITTLWRVKGRSGSCDGLREAGLSYSRRWCISPRSFLPKGDKRSSSTACGDLSSAIGYC